MKIQLPVILSALRSILVFVGGLAAGKGWLSAESVEPFVTNILAIVAAAAAAWGLVSKSKDTTKVEAANTVLTTAAVPVSDRQIAAAAATIQK